jgi:hypothetical protein
VTGWTQLGVLMVAAAVTALCLAAAVVALLLAAIRHTIRWSCDERTELRDQRRTSVRTCPAQTGPVWKLGGEPCGCVLPEGHDGDHTCSCGSWFIDSVRRDRPSEVPPC